MNAKSAEVGHRRSTSPFLHLIHGGCDGGHSASRRVATCPPPPWTAFGDIQRPASTDSTKSLTRSSSCRDPGRRREDKETIPYAPADLRLKQGKLSFTLTARYEPNRTHSTNEVQANIGDPNNEAQWLTKGIYQGGRADLDGFAPGILVWVRVRTVGLKGVMGAWSDPAQIRVI